MFFGVAIPAIIVGIIAWFYLADNPSKAKWLTAEEKTWLTGALEKEKKETAASNKHVSVRTVFGNGRVWMLSIIYFGFIYGLYALAFFLPTIIDGFEAHTVPSSMSSRRASSQPSPTFRPPSLCTSGPRTPPSAA